LPSGLPYSSRNKRLNGEQIKKAEQFAKIFHSCHTVERIKEELKEQDIVWDYVDAEEQHIFAAVRIGDIRILDHKPNLTEKTVWI
jgi:pantothenate synthetase